MSDSSWGLDGWTFGADTVQLSHPVGKRFFVLLGPWKVRDQIVVSATMDRRTGQTDFRTRPVEKSDGPRSWENRRFIARMRWGRAKRVTRERVRRMLGRDDDER